MTIRARRGAWWVAAGTLVAVWLAGEWLGPRLVASAYRQESLPLLNAVISGRDGHDLSFYLDAWPGLWRRAVAFLAVGTGLLWAGFRYRVRLVRGVGRALTTGPRLGPARFLWLAAWFGALGGLAEATHRSVRHLFVPHPRAFAWDIAWMAPLSAMASFVVLAGLALALLAVVRRTGRLVLRPTVFVLAFVACFGLLEANEFRLERYAVVVLCAGIAATATRWACADERRFRRTLRLSTPVIAGVLTGLLLAGLLGRPAAVERRANAHLPPPDDDAPSVLLIILDTVRASDLGLYGYARPTTPHLEAWADSGTVFDEAISTAPWTLTSHASMFTGRLPQEMSADFRVPLDDADPTLAEALRDRGYLTAGFVANLGYTSRSSGLARGFARYEDFPLEPGRFLTTAWLPRWIVNDVLPLPVERWAGADAPDAFGKKFGEEVTTSFLDWLSGTGDRPFFAFLNYMDAHTPYIPPAPYDSLFVEPGMDLDPVARHPENSIEEMAGQRALYDGAIAYLDAELGRLLEGLRAAGRLESTLVIVTADHGEQFGEHGLIGHGDSLYRPVIHVPLLVVFPGKVPPGRRIPEPVSLRNIAATVMDLVTSGPHPAFPGRSLRAYWEGRGPADRPAYSQVNVVPIARPWEPSYAGPMQSVIQGDLHLIEDGAGELELYDLAGDPMELDDLSGREAVAKPLADLEATLDSIAASGDGPPGP